MKEWNKPLHSMLKASRRRRVGNADDPNYPAALTTDYSGQAASDQIHARLLDDQPFMAARFGKAELDNLIPHFFSTRKSLLSNARAYVRGDIPQFWFKQFLIYDLTNNAGVFPRGNKTLSRFCEEFLADARQLDILGTWLTKEKYLKPLFPEAAWVPEADLTQPFGHPRPWSAALAGKRVLVVHPFVDTIEAQYRNHRADLFDNPHVLPEFELKTLRAVQSIAGNAPAGFRNWFEARDAMRARIDRIGFDIAIVGCGAYGLPLAAHIKAIGKKAVHMAGSTQLLFGIRGQRWDNTEIGRTLYRPSWCRASDLETPKNFQRVEGGCYW